MFYLSVAQKGINSPFEGIILAASVEFGVPVSLIKGIISKESAWNPNAASSSSYGLMQLNAVYFHDASGNPILDPGANIETGTSVIASQLQQRAGDEALALAGYNAGTSRTNEDLAARIAQNVNGVGEYVADVLQYRDWFLANDPASGGGGGASGNGSPSVGDGGGITSDAALMVGLLLVGLFIFVAMRD